jgi:hypothetical protein
MAAPWRGSMNPTPQERADRIDAHAMGRSHIEIATFGITPQASIQSCGHLTMSCLEPLPPVRRRFGLRIRPRPEPMGAVRPRRIETL